MNVKYSPNLGDGLLSECLEAALLDCGALEAVSIDLAARADYGSQMAGRGKIMAVLSAMPDWLRHQAVRVPLALASRRIWGPHYAAGLKGANAVVIGGGNLLSDHDLNFPTKLALALDTCRARKLPVAFFACGMAAHWSEEGDRRLRRALKDHPPAAVFLRDQASKERWDDRFAEVAGLEAEVVRDPGLMASLRYDPPARPTSGRPRIGLGIMSDVAIRYHSDARMGASELGRRFVDLSRALLDKGAQVVAFTNGSPEDIEMAEAIQSELREISVSAERPARPSDLAAIVAGCHAIAAYRMHAIIAAHSFGVPQLAFAWDDKVAAFLGSVGRSDCLHDFAALSAEEAADILLRFAEEGMEDTARAAVVAEAKADTKRLYDALIAAL
ncbi:polysaccharide pyruvyl transferase family protein [Jannaschia aquimarina]|nr:polysaccharide pyruvyl transferase family protein [Jannaschia aquimarina]